MILTALFLIISSTDVPLSTSDVPPSATEAAARIVDTAPSSVDIPATAAAASSCSSFMNTPFISMLLTVISGVLVFVISEYLKEIWLEPLQQYKRLKQEISEALVMYANYYGNPIDRLKENNLASEGSRIEDYDAVSKEIRLLASKLSGFSCIVNKIRFGIPSTNELQKASSSLIGISNSLICNGHEKITICTEHNLAYVKNVKDILKIDDLSENEKIRNKR